MKFINKILIVALFVGFSACNALELDLQDNPNAVTPENASVADLYNSVQLGFRNLFNTADGLTRPLMRMTSLTGGYQYINSFSPESFNGIWFTAYSDLLPDIEALIELADGRGLDIHSGSAKVMKAYTYMTLVDLFGSAALSEALLGGEALSPKLDDGASIYAAAESILDEAITQLSGTAAASPVANLFNSGSAEAWLKVANSLKLRTALTTRLVNPGESTSTINSLISGGNIIDEASEDFQFNYGSNRNNPNSRHPFYNTHYEAGDGNYMSTYYMWLLRAEKQTEDGLAVIDPRIRYYFYRQVEDATGLDANEYSCHFSIFPDQTSKPAHYNDVDPNYPYCVIPGDGYIGRDHLNAEGIPPDGNLRTVYGLYPGGGQFDDSSFGTAQQLGTTGALGQGINPIILSSFVFFMRAEAALTLGTTDNAREMLESGVRASIDKVLSFGSLVSSTLSQEVDVRGEISTVEELYVPTEEDVDEYVNFVMAQYDAAGSDDERLDIIAKEYYISLWGNGMDAYNLYRRTGKPANMAPSLEPGPGPFIRTFFYPAVHVNLNSTTSQNKSLTEQVFWDTNPADFVR